LFTVLADGAAIATQIYRLHRGPELQDAAEKWASIKQ